MVATDRRCCNALLSECQWADSVVDWLTWRHVSVTSHSEMRYKQCRTSCLSYSRLRAVCGELERKSKKFETTCAEARIGLQQEKPRNGRGRRIRWGADTLTLAPGREFHPRMAVTVHRAKRDRMVKTVQLGFCDWTKFRKLK